MAMWSLRSEPASSSGGTGARSDPSIRSQRVTTKPVPACWTGHVPGIGRAISAPRSLSSTATAYSRRTSSCECARTATFATTGSGRSHTTVLFVSCNRTGWVLMIRNWPATSVAARTAEFMPEASRTPVNHRQTLLSNCSPNLLPNAGSVGRFGTFGIPGYEFANHRRIPGSLPSLELAEVGDDDLLSEALGVRGVQSTSEEHLRQWSRGGALLASSVQMAWYR